MGYQLGLILVIIFLALIISKKLSKKKDDTEQLIYEDEMTNDELEEIDNELH